MKCEECGQIVKSYHNTRFPGVPVYCKDCKELYLSKLHQTDFRFEDIEGSLQYNRGQKKKSMDEQEEGMQ
jgi:hypothetical protein